MKLDIMTLVNCEITLMIPVFLGFIISKTGILTEEFSRKLASFMLYCLHPLYVITAVCGIERTEETLGELWKTALLSLGVHLFIAVIAVFVLMPMKNVEKKNIIRAGLIFRNVGFFAVPILGEIFGEIGAFRGAVNLVVFNFLFWTLCTAILNRAKGERSSFRSVFNIGTLACVAGIVIFVSGIKIYPPVFDSMKSVGSACMPVSLIIIGGIIGRQPVKQMFTNVTAYVSAGAALTVLPVIVMFAARLVGLPEKDVVFATVTAAVPMATNVAAYAETKNADPPFAAQLVGLSVLMTMLTLPLLPLIFKL